MNSIGTGRPATLMKPAIRAGQLGSKSPALKATCSNPTPLYKPPGDDLCANARKDFRILRSKPERHCSGNPIGMWHLLSFRGSASPQSHGDSENSALPHVQG